MSDAKDKIKAAAARMKVFPLPSVALLPGSAIPLHIFEQRYREMIADAVATDGVFALAHVLAKQEKNADKSPALEPMVCAGVIAFHEPMTDGRHNLVLIGVTRARIKFEHPQTHLYREVEVEILEDAPAADEELRQALLELVARLPQEVAHRLLQSTSHVSGGALADVVAATISQDVVRRTEVLNELNVERRIKEVADDILMLAAGIRLKKHTGPMN
jgi:uncharacterized protein